MPAAKLFGEPSRLIQMYSIANMRIYFGMAKEKAETFLWFPLFIEPFSHVTYAGIGRHIINT